MSSYHSLCILVRSLEYGFGSTWFSACAKSMPFFSIFQDSPPFKSRVSTWMVLGHCRGVRKIERRPWRGLYYLALTGCMQTSAILLRFPGLIFSLSNTKRAFGHNTRSSMDEIHIIAFRVPATTPKLTQFLF